MELAPLKARTGRCENIGEDVEKIAGSLPARGKEILYLSRIWIYINTKWRRRPELFHRRFILRPLEGKDSTPPRRPYFFLLAISPRVNDLRFGLFSLLFPNYEEEIDKMTILIRQVNEGWSYLVPEEVKEDCYLQAAVLKEENARKRKSDDVGWEYGSLADVSNKDKVKCLFCNHVIIGGVYRHKQHVAHVGNFVAKCKKSSQEAKDKCKKSLEEASKKRKENTSRELEL
ncbi:hypothetical protein TRIUR3_24222 [Triticum urartu]|uniref:BED-type domain-containing protein n=1 Tax=Triticum urartu TaxID=4572 RepID=M8AG43_TRIUA|nr:hypothetical protein TRIUR3_24222 [Triticum urartu]